MGDKELLDLHDRLREDPQRAALPFSDDIADAGRLMHRPFRTDDEVAEALRQWCLKRQPCQFGRLAAGRGQIFFCVIRERDLADGDAAVARKIAEAKRHWKQRAVSDRHRPPHGFLLVFTSPAAQSAAPDDSLKRFAEKLLYLAGWGPERRTRRSDNAITSDFLYLRNPTDDKYYGFQFNVDFFAAAGDRRWWHDHRLPGGIGFTANSTGHMRFFRDWYESPGSDHGEWALKQAMLTIGSAEPVEIADKKCPVTWLRDLDHKGRPLVPDTPCPLNPVSKQLTGKDWTRYEGYLHTDHAIRKEFFVDRDLPVTAHKPYLMDFTYLYDTRLEDFTNFSGGKLTAEEEVFEEIGRPDTWTHRAGAIEPTRSPEESVEIAELMAKIYAWEPLPTYLDREVPS
ncbi:MAG: hypothetical protein K2V38_28155 [Gemmataceae bacterium]|nr:hypothetical protein [Gemmataceae bacterium]